MAENKIAYGLKNVHYAKLTETIDPSTGAVTYSYGTVKAWPGAVSMSLEPQGETLKEYADDSVYYTLAQNMGYEGDFEYETMPEDFRENILNEESDENDVMIEKSGKPTTYFALMFEVNGDAHKSKKLFYKCSANRETVENSTTEDSIEATHGKITITAVPRADELVKASTKSTTPSEIVTGWYTDVYEPDFTP